MVAQQHQKSLLVVDDDAAIRFLITQLFEDVGYNVRAVANGAEALADLRHAAALPCTILLDLNMPVMTGWEFRTEQQRDPRLAPIPVVVISADRSLDQAPFSIDATGYFTKPINFPQLITLVDQLCV